MPAAYRRASKSGDSNYHTATATQSITINKATPTIAINNISEHTYNGEAIANPTAEQVTVTGARYADIEFLYSSSMSGPFVEQAPKDAGSYYVRAKIPETNNTNLALSQEKDFLIRKQILQITDGTAAPKKYDGTTSASVTELIFSGLQNGENGITSTLTALLPEAPKSTAMKSMKKA